MKKDEYILFECLGDKEKNILATVIVGLLAKKYPERKILVVSNLLEIWLHNPNVYRVFYYASTPYFYEDYLEGKNTLIFRQDPFKTNDFLHQDTHILTLWAKLCEVEYGGEKPELFFTQREKEIIQRLVKREKPILIFNPFEVGIQEPYPRRWARNIPDDTAKRIANELLALGFHLITNSDQNTPQIQGVEKINLPGRLSLALPFSSVGIITAHSHLLHLGKFFNLPTTVIWTGNTPTVYGYTDQKNILPAVFRETFCEPWCLNVPPANLMPFSERDFFEASGEEIFIPRS